MVSAVTKECAVTELPVTVCWELDNMRIMRRFKIREREGKTKGSEHPERGE
jgi:hypothetical protein